MRKLIIAALILSGSLSLAQRRRPPPTRPPTFTYDLSASVGSYDGNSYTELNLGLNWFLSEDWLIWRNALFSRFGSGFDTITGLDSSLRFAHRISSDSGTFGINMFAGPGLRFANQNSNAVFGEAGLLFRIGGLQVGGGVKALQYTQTRTDSRGRELSKNDTQFFIILAGGGAF